MMMGKPTTAPCLFGTALFLLFTAVCQALYADEAGLNDFVIRTAGHGQVGVRYASLVHGDDGNNIWVTSQSNEFPGAVTDEDLADSSEVTSKFDPIIGKINSLNGQDSGCSIAGRNVTSGQVLWRVDAGSSTVNNKGSSNNGEFKPRHVTLASNKGVYSIDNVGVFRGWNSNDGMLQFDKDLFQQINISDEKKEFIFPNDMPRLLETTHPSIVGTVVRVEGEDDDDESLVLIDINDDGKPISSTPSPKDETRPQVTISAKSLLSKANVAKEQFDSARIVDIVFVKGGNNNGDKKTEGHFSVLVSWSSTSKDITAPQGTKVSKSISTFSSMAVIDIVLREVVQTTEPPEASAPKSEDYDDWSTTLIKSLSYSFEVVGGTPLNVEGAGSTPLQLSSLRKVTGSSGYFSLLAIAATTTQILLVNNISASGAGNSVAYSYEIDMLHPYWRMIETISVPQIDFESNRATLLIAGVDDRYPSPRRIESLFALSLNKNEEEEAFHRINGSKKGDEEVMHDVVTYCPSFKTNGLVVTTMSGGGDGINVTPYTVNDERTAWASTPFHDDSSFLSSVLSEEYSIGLDDRAHLLECSEGSVVVALTTMGGMSTVFRFETSSESSVIESARLWSSEEAMGSVTSTIFLDETHTNAMPVTSEQDATGNADFEEDQALRNLEFSSRIQMQLESLKEFVLGGGLLSSLKSVVIMSDEKKAERDIAFGFAKVAVLLSENLHRVIALDTMKRNVIWAMNLNSAASWHKIVHGGQFVSLNDSHGNGGVNDHEMLAMSYIEKGSSSFVEWKCFDGLSSKIFSADRSPVNAPVSQIVPLRTTTHQSHLDSSGCRQVVLLVHSDETVSVVPNTVRSRLIVKEAIASIGKQGLFVHSIDKHSGEFRSQIVSWRAESESFDLTTIGTTVFDPSQEKIFNVVYPRRGEVIQSPSTVLGDESLLLKYLNPHLVVVVTEATPTYFSKIKSGSDADKLNEDSFYDLLSTTSSSSQQIRKPLGATRPGEGNPSLSKNIAAPSLFVSIVDSVSGQILHRVSHAHVDNPDDLLKTSQVPVTVSENWVVYTFFNERTRRTDVGVLTLHEGMIDKNGITAFSAPEQELTFSSLQSSKPIVLSRIFGLAKAVSALGVTSTKAGISSKQFLFATGNDQIISLDRRFLDPRRPNGDLKDSEKTEGLMKYAPMLPIIPFLTPSHVHEVSSVQSIASASAHVESQSLVLAHGGPDIFFSRLSPSKGFDLLPDDFNRGLLTVVVVGLLVALGAIQQMNKKKLVTSFWS